ncbi:MAG: cupin domain-containing protein [Atopobiaceae bacterium]|nr:cupin domain-containing protein [Atopobiaceae bacterium]
MNETAGRTFSIADENSAAEGCTISRAIEDSNGNTISYFSLGQDTDISAELYSYPKIHYVVSGTLEETGANPATLKAGDAYLTPIDVPSGQHATEDTVYLEIALAKDSATNLPAEAGKAFTLADAVPYADGRIVNRDLAHNAHLKLVEMAFDAGTGLSEHAAPGDALLLALDGEATVIYEGKEHALPAGSAFKFDAGGRHAIRADKRFKMALLISLV